MASPVPLTILGGSDHRPAELPSEELHPLGEYKGVGVRVGGRPLIEVLVERVARSRGFGPITIAGPRRVYEPLGLDATLLDTDASVAGNLRVAIEHHVALHEGPLAVLACDVLPGTDELDRLREAQAAEPVPPALWFPFVRVPSDPDELGAFGWKPTYRMIPPSADAERAPVAILPSHLCIFEPRALRLGLLYRLMDLAYETRNHSVGYRRRVILRRVLTSLLGRDLSKLVRLRAPVVTITVLRSGLRLARRLRSGAIEIEELEQLIGRIFLDPLRQATLGLGGIRYPITDVTSLAKDVDTVEEARSLAGDEGG